MATLFDKKKYVLHGAALKMYMALELDCDKIHRAMRFTQAPIFREFIGSYYFFM